ncbi:MULTISPECIES: zinc finger domain-containing protein [Streptomyces]|uniref:Cell surface glycoprotein n=1 Tax=Streptomyces dengpaensis TaxID=2049881 RepID=A0ABN5I5Q9_9ACTN|nr:MULTISPECIES: cell surface glycoprotein [Streptomyces]AVH58407.1 cell surface glycoprotein [Streptomyces dengpaensis]PIB06081.1 hypothetical protein B1C81_26225 [Streptomyces sp. HG99]
MTPAEAAELLTLAAAFDRRTVGEADARAWAAALNSTPLDDDARAAVARHYAETDKWLTPAHVRQQRAKIRADRVTAANVVYDGRAGETGAESIARRRAQLDAVANGRIAPQSITRAIGFSEDRPALPAGATREEREDFAAERLAALGSYVPRSVADALAEYRPHRAERESLAQYGQPDPLDVPCPYEPCRAPASQPCRMGASRRHRATAHPSRLDAATTHHNARQEQHA